MGYPVIEYPFLDVLINIKIIFTGKRCSITFQVLDILYLIGDRHFLEKSAFDFQAADFETYVVFRTSSSPFVFFARGLYQKVRVDPQIVLSVLLTNKMAGQLPLQSLFVGASLIRIFLHSLIN